MVLVISTFKVANGMESAVRQAFFNRPHLVDDAAGFLGMEVVVDRLDASKFHLLTRWIDEASFQNWYSSPLHKLSHRGIPKGLKLDPSHTAVRRFDVVHPGGQAGIEPEDPLIAKLSQFLAGSTSIHWLRASLTGEIIAANGAFDVLFHESTGALAGRSLWNWLTEADADAVQGILQSGEAGSDHSMALNFVEPEHRVCTLQCHVEVRRKDFVLVGEPVRQHDRALAEQLMEMNNQWALLVRENERNLKALRQAKEELERTLAELNRSHWHLRKIQETLPICMYCGKVKTGEAHWEGVVDYLKKNSLFLSHGCCPGCLDKLWGGLGQLE